MDDIRDHPRSRGVYAPPVPPIPTHLGSSPLARGLPPIHLTIPYSLGIIPARAGFTTRSCPGRTGATDHPRSRGVYAVPGNPGGSVEGSSPLARGLRHPGCDPRVARGIIPARAGFTGRRRRSGGSRRDHPRSRGVYYSMPWWGDSVEGSSPLARGLRPQQDAAVVDGGIIPARAGFTPTASDACSHRWDHPRSRGVYAARRRWRSWSLGSSPLARGLPSSRGTARPTTGIIPARAGFTSGRSRARRATMDHPRSRGVYLLLI